MVQHHASQPVMSRNGHRLSVIPTNRYLVGGRDIDFRLWAKAGVKEPSRLPKGYTCIRARHY